MPAAFQEYSERIAIEQPTRATDAQGSVSTTWTVLKTVWSGVKISGKSSSETTDLDQRAAHQSARFTVRYSAALAAITSASRVVWKGSAWDILSITPEPPGRPEKLIIEARRKAD